MVELVRVVEPGRVVHRDLGAEAAIAEVGPVADIAVADADDVGQAVAGEVGQVDGLRAVGEDDARAFLFVERLRDAPRRAEALFGQRGVPDEGVVLGDEHIGVAVAVEIDELHVGVARVAVQARGERAEGLPAFGLVMFIQARRRSLHDDDIGLTIAGQVHELRTATQGDIGLKSDRFERGELRPHCLAAVG